MRQHRYTEDKRSDPLIARVFLTQKQKRKKPFSQKKSQIYFCPRCRQKKILLFAKMIIIPLFWLRNTHSTNHKICHTHQKIIRSVTEYYLGDWGALTPKKKKTHPDLLTFHNSPTNTPRLSAFHISRNKLTRQLHKSPLPKKPKPHSGENSIFTAYLLPYRYPYHYGIP